MASAHPTTNGSNGSYGVQDQYNSAGSQYAAENGSSAEKSGPKIDKDEVGWYFVERYYNTLSDKPDSLHLFYNKRSQFTHGEEQEVVPVLVGRIAIQEHIRKLGFAGSKVRVSNVDCQQADGECIAIQVIGEICSASKELKKFVQTFVLAKQPHGFFVLNDIFRSLKDAEEEQEVPAVQEAVSAAEEEVVADLEEPKNEELETTKLDADVVDQKLESALASESTAEAPTTNGNGITTEVEEAEEAPVAAVKPEPTPEVIEKQVEEEAVKEIEKPSEPSPSPAATPAAPTVAPPKAKPAVPTQPPKPMTWASRAAAAAAAAAPPKVAPAAPKTATPPVQHRAASSSAPSAPASQKTATPAEPAAEKESDSIQSSGWQTAGSEQKRQARPQSVSSPVEKEGTLGYVRNVTEKVNAEELRASLTKHGELVYFDVNRQKNCAFIEFATTNGYLAAVAANPHVLGGENIIVEPRRPKAAAYGGAGYNNTRGGAMNGRGRGGFEQGRPGSQGGRGGFVQRGRGGAPGNAPRGGAVQRPAGQTTTA